MMKTVGGIVNELAVCLTMCGLFCYKAAFSTNNDMYVNPVISAPAVHVTGRRSSNRCGVRRWQTLQQVGPTVPPSRPVGNCSPGAKAATAGWDMLTVKTNRDQNW